MMEAVFSTDLRCQKCLRTIGPVLDAEVGVRDWEADLDDPRKLLRVQLDALDQAPQVQELLTEAGYSSTLLSESESAEPKSIEHQSPVASGVSLATYKPLLLVVAYVLGATLLAESIHGEFDWRRAMSYFMGFFFLGFAFFKLLGVTAFADAFSTYDIIAKRSRGYALAYPYIELALGLLFVTRTSPVLASALTAVVMGVGLVGVVAAVRKKQAIQCACLGTVFNLPMTVVTIVENSTMIAMAVVMLVL
ncbi:hypothetical protein MalM25_08200 [Planctomycetes bacterium MalM25]|nr:hypothetical protein MalM25_08200 [Planctomycetes bacterium MalM25]